MKKWITFLGVVVGVVILLLYQSDGRKMLHLKPNESSKIRVGK